MFIIFGGGKPDFNNPLVVGATIVGGLIIAAGMAYIAKEVIDANKKCNAK